MTIRESIKFLKENPEKRIKWITIVTMTYNFVWAVCKIIFGVFKSAYLYCISGGYTILIGFVKKTFISNRNKSVNKNTKALTMGVLLLLSGVAFGLYMARLYVWPREYNYGLVWSIGLACCSFVELGLAIYNVIKVKKKKDILLYSLRCCSLVSAVFAIVITQISLLAATSATNVAYFNATSGILAGVFAILIGSAVIIKATPKIDSEAQFTKRIESTAKIKIAENEKSEDTKKER